MKILPVLAILLLLHLLLFSGCASPTVERARQALERGTFAKAREDASALITSPSSTLDQKLEASRLLVETDIAAGDLESACHAGLEALGRFPDDPSLLATTADLLLVAGETADQSAMAGRLETFARSHLESEDTLLLERARLLLALGDPRTGELASLAAGAAKARGDATSQAQALQILVLLAIENEDWPVALEHQEERAKLLGENTPLSDFALLGCLRLQASLDLDGARACWARLPASWQYRLQRAYGL
ncbi:MAG: hypothetical protein AB1486_04530 [Planctomycetota bacterium]